MNKQTTWSHGAYWNISSSRNHSSSLKCHHTAPSHLNFSNPNSIDIFKRFANQGLAFCRNAAEDCANTYHKFSNIKHTHQKKNKKNKFKRTRTGRCDGLRCRRRRARSHRTCPKQKEQRKEEKISSLKKKACGSHRTRHRHETSGVDKRTCPQSKKKKRRCVEKRPKPFASAAGGVQGAAGRAYKGDFPPVQKC